MTKILKGDTSANITIAFATGYDYEGSTVHVDFLGARRSFASVTAGGTVSFNFTAEETKTMPLGTFPVHVTLVKNGLITTIKNGGVKISVTDDISEVHAGAAIAVDVKGGLFGITDLPARYTDADVVAKLREILRKGGAALCAAFLCLGLFADTNRVQTARKDSIYNDAQVVTNVDLTGFSTITQLEEASNNVITAAKSYTDSAVQQAGSMTPEIATNIAGRVVTNIVPSWARAENPPEAMPNNGLVLVNNAVKTKGGTTVTAANVGALSTAGGTVSGDLVLESGRDACNIYGGSVITKGGGMGGGNMSLVDAVNYNDWDAFFGIGTLRWSHCNYWDNNCFEGLAIGLTSDDEDDGGMFAVDAVRGKLHYVEFKDEKGKRTYKKWNYLLPRTWKQNSSNPHENTYTLATTEYAVPVTRKVNGQPLTNDITITAAQVGAVSTAQLSPVSTAANNALAYGQGIYQYMHANTNAWFEGTNYNVDVAQSLNKVKYSPEAWENVAYTPCSLQLYEIRNGSRQCVWDQRDWTVYYWNFKSAQLSNNLATATANLSNSVANNYMRKGWAKYTAVNGVTNPANDTLWVDTSKVSLMAGKQWEKMIELGGAGYWTLTGNGVTISTNVAQSTFLSIKDFEGNACLTFRKTSSYLVYCEYGTEITGQLYDGQGRVCFTVNTDTCPIAEFTTVLEDDTFVEQGATGCPADYEWTGSAGAWVCHFKLKSGIVSNACFARFKVEHEGENVVEHTVPVKLDGGIVFTQGGTQYKIKPSISGGNVVWSVVQ